MIYPKTAKDLLVVIRNVLKLMSFNENEFIDSLMNADKDNPEILKEIFPND